MRKTFSQTSVPSDVKIVAVGQTKNPRLGLSSTLKRWFLIFFVDIFLQVGFSRSVTHDQLDSKSRSTRDPDKDTSLTGSSRRAWHPPMSFDSRQGALDSRQAQARGRAWTGLLPKAKDRPRSAQYKLYREHLDRSAFWNQNGGCQSSLFLDQTTLDPKRPPI